MAAQAKRKKEARTSLVRIVSLSLAGLMLHKNGHPYFSGMSVFMVYAGPRGF